MNRIRASRLAAGLSVAELARRAQVAPSNLSAIESGTRSASPEMINKILDASGRPSAILKQNREWVLAAIAKTGCSHARVFGSIARGEDIFGSDIDLLVTYERGNSRAFCALPRVISEALGVAVDIITEGGLRATDSHILNEAVPL